MAPDANETGSQSFDDGVQYLFIVRHGERMDLGHPEWKDLPTSRLGDCPISPLGHQQAYDVGQYLDSWMHDEGLSTDDMAWLTSPFLRCVETANGALNGFRKLNARHVPIYAEPSIFEWDGNGGEWHRDLPTIEERKHYFPRLDLTYEIFFEPELPEPRNKFFERCQKSIDCFHERYPYKPGQVLVMVSHAAGCIALAKAFAKMKMAEITPAAACSIYRLTRSSNTDTWSLDAHDDLDGFNGYVGHLSEMGDTIPWNNLGDGYVKFYTGPPDSRFAPKTET
eukprot:scaffold5296_cov215-Cylindrotheca_fusiformis.AAC.8